MFIVATTSRSFLEYNPIPSEVQPRIWQESPCDKLVDDPSGGIFIGIIETQVNELFV